MIIIKKEMTTDIQIPKIIKDIALAIDQQGGQANIVGGFVRDHLMGRGNVSFDIDVEVFGMTFLQLHDLLLRFGKVKVEGQAFAAILLTVGDETFDFTLPRVDNKTGVGHTGFQVNVDPNMSFKEAARRRDFTINSIAINALTGEIIDPWNGMEDMKNKVLKPTSFELFVQDPLRILRGLDFACRFDFFLDESFFDAAISLKNEFVTLPKERIEKQFVKWAKKGKNKSQLLFLLKKTGWIEFFPELLKKNSFFALMDTPFFFGKVEETLAILIQGMNEKEKKSFLDRVILEKSKKIEIIELSNFFDMLIHNEPEDPKVKVSFFLSKAKIDPIRVKQMVIAFTGFEPASFSFIPDLFSDLKRLVTGNDLIALGVKPGPEIGILLNMALMLQCQGLGKEEILKELKNT